MLTMLATICLRTATQRCSTGSLGREIPGNFSFPGKWAGNFRTSGIPEVREIPGKFPGNSREFPVSREFPEVREFPVPREILVPQEFPEIREIPETREFPRSKNFPPVSREMGNSREFPARGFPLNIAAVPTKQNKTTTSATSS